MDVLLITKSGKNYGAVLQAYALFAVLKNEGCSVRVLNFPSDALRRSFQTFKFQSKSDWIFNALRLLKYRKLAASNRRFLEFRNGNIEFTRPYKTVEEAELDPPKADLYLVGSDQVWNPKIRFSPAYFAAFGDSKTRRRSYSASIGLERLPQEWTEKFRSYWKAFDAISTREESGAAILRELGFDARTTVDPTLLLSREEWAAQAVKPATDKKYVLVYALHYSDLLKSTASQVKRRLNVPIKSLATSVASKKFGDEIVWDAGPREFLGLVQNASFVVTSSYHGMLFALNFGVPFAAIPPSSTRRRFYDLLESVGLENRVVENASEIPEELYSFDRDIPALREKIARSREYLREILNVR